MSRAVDNAPRYVPDVTIVNGQWVRVSGSVAYPPGSHPAGCPLVPDCTALEMQTPRGSRWWGFDRVWINSELRMVAQGFPARCEIRGTWEKVRVLE